MFDFHLHSEVSHDSTCSAEKIAKKAEELGLKEICFTDHFDDYTDINQASTMFDLEEYRKAYKNLSSSSVKVRFGVEVSLTGSITKKVKELFENQSFDFVIGSVHSIDSGDPYGAPFWVDKTADRAWELYLGDMYRNVKFHDNFDVLGHLTYMNKCPPNPDKTPVPYRKYADIFDEIFRALISKGKGLEINTSGIAACGVFLPDRDYLTRFKELGGEIITVGSDAHNEARVGHYTKEALEILGDIFGYVCTFEERKPIFHRA